MHEIRKQNVITLHFCVLHPPAISTSFLPGRIPASSLLWTISSLLTHISHIYGYGFITDVHTHVCIYNFFVFLYNWGHTISVFAIFYFHIIICFRELSMTEHMELLHIALSHSNSCMLQTVEISCFI